MKITPHIFREYDVRGTVGTDLSEEFAYVLGRAFAGLVKDNGAGPVMVGCDARLSSGPYAASLARGIADSGVDVQMTGMGATPQLYFSLHARKAGGGVQVTGSHNPPEMNGFKLCLGTRTLSGPEIQELKARVLSIAPSCPPPVAKKGSISNSPIQDEYINTLVQNCRPHIGKRRLKVVVDAGNGVGGLAGPAVLRGLGVEVLELFCEPDGRFPNHHPDPTIAENISVLCSRVRETGADFGIGWDGDADRIVVVDEKGQALQGDMLLLIFGREILKEKPGAAIIADVKSSSRFFDDLTRRGANAIMWKSGHSLIKSKLRESGAELGGELAGHIVFKHRFYGFDDAIYATARFAEIASNREQPVSQFLADLPAMVATEELRNECPEELKFRIQEKIQQAFPDCEINTIDGVRVTFAHGWGLARASNTQPVLVTRFEADTEEHLNEYRNLFESRLEEIKRQLKQ